MKPGILVTKMTLGIINYKKITRIISKILYIDNSDVGIGGERGYYPYLSFQNFNSYWPLFWDTAGFHCFMMIFKNEKGYYRGFRHSLIAISVIFQIKTSLIAIFRIKTAL